MMVPRTASSKMAEAGTRGKRAEFQLICEGHGTKMRSNSFQKLQARSAEASMRVMRKQWMLTLGGALGLCAATNAQHIGKYVPIAAGSEADHAMQEINAATDPAQKLALIDKFASGLGQGNMEIVTDELYVNYYLSQKNYAKTYEYGDKLFAIDADNLQNAVNLVRAASEAGDTDKLLLYGEKTSGLLQRFSASAAPSYQQAQDVPKMLEVANGLLAKDPNNLGMLLLLADYYGEKGEQLDKAEAYAKKAAGLADTAPKPEGVAEDQWKQETTLQKGIALSSLGQVNLQKKDNAGAVQNLQAAAPLLKSNDVSYARNQFRLGYAYLNLKKLPEAKQAFTEAASVNSPYKQPALDKLKGLPARAPATRKRAS